MTVTAKEELENVDTAIKTLKERRREIYKASVDAPENEKVCEDYLAEAMGERPLGASLEYPVSISGITFSGEIRSKHSHTEAGGLVKVRPCSDNPESHTYLGVHLGDLALGVAAHRNRETEVLEFRLGHHNPAMWIPATNRIVYGCDSWWGSIENEDDLRAITDKTIDNVWYVKLMKGSKAAEPAEPDNDAATDALDAIAKLCGVEKWEYPGQVVRDVEKRLRDLSPEEDKALPKRLREIADAEGGPLFLGWPDRWYEDRHVRCFNEHVSTTTLGTEEGARCLACGECVYLTFPEDRDGPLSYPGSKEPPG